MSVSTKGFITIRTNPTEALNKVVHAFVRLCSQNHILNQKRHPFHLKALEMGSDKCFYVIFENDREEAGKNVRQVQIGFFEDTIGKHPQGDKISFSVGAYGDSEFIIKNGLVAAMKALGVGDSYFQQTDYNETFEGPLSIEQLTTK